MPLTCINDADIPDDLKCPISGDLMMYPFTAADNRTYDLKSINRHIRNHLQPGNTWIESPIFGAPPLPNITLNFNEQTNEKIKQFLAARNICYVHELVNALAKKNHALLQKLNYLPQQITMEFVGSATLLHQAVFLADMVSTNILMRDGANVNATDINNHTPLHLAAAKGKATLIAPLCTYGANPRSRDLLGYTPLHLAASMNQRDCAAVLIAQDMRLLDETDNNGSTPLHLTVHQKALHCVKLFCQTGIVERLDVQDLLGNTPLHIAVMEVDSTNPKTTSLLVSLLLNYGAHFNIQNNLNLTARDLVKLMPLTPARALLEAQFEFHASKTVKILPHFAPLLQNIPVVHGVVQNAGMFSNVQPEISGRQYAMNHHPPLVAANLSR